MVLGRVCSRVSRRLCRESFGISETPGSDFHVWRRLERRFRVSGLGPACEGFRNLNPQPVIRNNTGSEPAKLSAQGRDKHKPNSPPKSRLAKTPKIVNHLP